MAFNDLVVAAQKYYPSLTIKYKNQSNLMKIIGKLMFFNPGFMTDFITTLGTTIYVPNEQYMQNQPESTCDVFIHECTHMYDEKRMGFIYKLAYLFPQLLSPMILFLLFVLTWKIVLPLSLFCLLPLPAPWRTYFEKRAYFVQMYVGHKLFQMDLDRAGPAFALWFRDSSYYWMWAFEKDQSFAEEAMRIKAGNPACAAEPALLQMVNDLMAAAIK